MKELMKVTSFKDLHSRFYVYQNQRIERIAFINSLSLGFVESIAFDCDFLDSENLIFHKSKIKDSTFSGSCLNVIFDNCELERCKFDKAQLLKVSFPNGTTIKDSTGLPPTKRWLEKLPYSKQR